jgi:2-keto-4-pentenoate hydratase
MGHPLNAVKWLARTMVRQGRPLRAGDVVLSGALGPMTNVAAGDSLHAEICALGSVSVRFV